MNIQERNNLIFMEFHILGLPQKVIAHKHGIGVRHVKRIISEIRKNERRN